MLARLLPLALAALVALACARVARASVALYGVGIPDGYTVSEAWGVSDDGSLIVGRYRDSSDQHAFRWTAADGMLDLPGVPGHPARSLATGASGDGSVVIGSVANPSENFGPFRWTSSGGMSLIPDTPVFTSTVSDITPDGSIAVGGGSSGSYFQTSDGVVTGLGDLPGGSTFSSANGISADGSVIVGFGTNAQATQAYRWTLSGGMVPLGDLPGGPFRSIAEAISSDGSTIVGGGDVSPSTSQAFRWRSETGMVGLGFLPGANYSNATSVSADGSIVVGISSAPFQPTQAFLWTQTTGMLRLYDYLLDLGATGLTGWTLSEATGMTPDGRTIVGYGLNPQGQVEGWVAVVPEPATWTLAVAGALVVAAMAIARKPRASAMLPR